MNDKLIGKRLANRYEIQELIGLGGMASVYRAHCDLLKRDVAIKILKPEARRDPMVLKSFQAEAQASAGLSDVNIVSIFDVGEEDGIDYIVMELVQGVTLKQYIRSLESIEWHTALDFASQICHALAVAHGAGVIHRDIKPQNIMVTSETIIKVTDFGIARANSNSEGGTINTNDAMGSVHYISPEQARGGFVDFKSDIYSLGIVMYEMLTGKVPFDNKNAMAVAVMHIEQEAPLVSEVNPNIPLPVARLVAKAMAKESANRYATVAELDSYIQAILDADRDGTPMDDYDDVDATKKIDTEPKGYIDDDDEYFESDPNVIVLSGDAITEAGAKPSDDSMGPRATSTAEVDDYFDDYDPYEEDDEDDEPQRYKLSHKERKARKTRRKSIRRARERSSEDKKADRRATITAIATVLLIIAIVAGIFNYKMYSSNRVYLSNYVGDTIKQVEKELSNKDIEIVEERSEYSDTVKKGVIISQNPPKGWSKKDDNTLYVVTSKGPSGGTHKVPNVVGMSIDDAQAKILNADMAYDFIWDSTTTEVTSKDESITLESIKVTAEAPVAGTKLKKIDEASDDDEADVYTVYIKVNCSATKLAELLGVPVGQNIASPTVAPTEAPTPTPEPENPNEVTLIVPSEGDPSGIFKVTVDGDVVFDAEKQQGDDIKITLTGEGEHQVEAFYDDVKCYSEIVKAE